MINRFSDRSGKVILIAGGCVKNGKVPERAHSFIKVYASVNSSINTFI